MTSERRYGLLVMGLLALVSVYLLYSGIAAMAAFVVDVTSRARNITAYSGDVAVVPGACTILMLAVVEIVRPPEHWRSRLFGMALVFFAGTIVLPIVFLLASGPALSPYGYVRCYKRVVGYTLPAVRYAVGRGHCRAAN